MALPRALTRAERSDTLPQKRHKFFRSRLRRGFRQLLVIGLDPREEGVYKFKGYSGGGIKMMRFVLILMQIITIFYANEAEAKELTLRCSVEMRYQNFDASTMRELGGGGYKVILTVSIRGEEGFIVGDDARRASYRVLATDHDYHFYAKKITPDSRKITIQRNSGKFYSFTSFEGRGVLLMSEENGFCSPVTVKPLF